MRSFRDDRSRPRSSLVILDELVEQQLDEPFHTDSFCSGFVQRACGRAELSRSAVQNYLHRKRVTSLGTIFLCFTRCHFLRCAFSMAIYAGSPHSEAEETERHSGNACHPEAHWEMLGAQSLDLRGFCEDGVRQPIKLTSPF